MTNDAPVVYVVDDDAGIRDTVKRICATVGLQVEVFGTAAAFLKHPTAADRPTCLVLDVRMPGMSGLELQRELGTRNRVPQIVFITGYGNVPMSVRCIKRGAVDFLTKPFSSQELLDAIHRAIDTDRRIAEEHRRLSKLRARHETLTPREHEVFPLVATGLPNKQIAHELGISERTVKAHRANVMLKLRAESLAELVRIEALLHAEDTED